MSDDMRNNDTGGTGSEPRRLTRRTDERVLTGVAAGFARYFRVDPLVARLIFVGLGLYGGLGVLIYVAAWALMPVEGGDAGSTPRTRERLARVAGIGLIVIAGLAFLRLFLGLSVGAPWWGRPWGPIRPDMWLEPVWWPFRPSVILAALLIGFGVLLYRAGSNRSGGTERAPAVAGETRAAPADSRAAPDASPGTPGAAGQVPPAPGAAASGAGPAAPAAGSQPDADAGPPEDPSASAAGPGPEHGGGAVAGPPFAAEHRPPGEPRPPRQPSPLGRLTLAAAFVTVGVAALLDRTGVLELRIADLLAIALLVVGLGLLVGAWLGRARWLIAIGFALLPFVAVAALLSSAPWERARALDAANQVHRPTTIEELREEYAIGAGSLTLDLTQLELPEGEEVTVSVDVAAGELRVLLPGEQPAVVNASALIGNVVLPGWSSAGFVLVEERALAGEGDGIVRLDLSVRAGVIDVGRSPAASEPPDPERPGSRAEGVGRSAPVAPEPRAREAWTQPAAGVTKGDR